MVTVRYPVTAWLLYGIPLQHSNGTASRNIDMGSHCYHAFHPITIDRYGRGTCTATGLAFL
jgi:hypothetical protein